MVRTVGKHWPVGIGPDRQAICSYCGVQWRRSQLRRDASGNLACPDEGPGLDVVSLSEGNARLMRSQQPKVIGPIDGSFDTFVSPPSPGFVNANGPPTQLPNQGPIGPMSVVVNMWLRADSTVQATTAGRVSTWTDLSNRGNHVPAPSVAAQPAWTESDATLGNLPTVSGDGLDRYLTLPEFRGGAPFWAWLIYRMDVASPGALMGAGVEFVGGATPGTVRLQTNAGLTAENAGSAVGQWARAIISFNVAGTDSLQVKGVSVSAASAGQRQASFTLFSAQGGASASACSFAEVLLADGAPTAEEIAGIEAYGRARYGEGLFA